MYQQNNNTLFSSLWKLYDGLSRIVEELWRILIAKWILLVAGFYDKFKRTNLFILSRSSVASFQISDLYQEYNRVDFMECNHIKRNETANQATCTTESRQKTIRVDVSALAIYYIEEILNPINKTNYQHDKNTEVLQAKHNYVAHIVQRF